MAANARRTEAGASIPPIETGSFSLRNREETNFVGSASGIFFVHTVFKAFSELPFSQQRHGDSSAMGSPEASVLVGGHPASSSVLEAGQDHNRVGLDAQESSQIHPERQQGQQGRPDDTSWLNNMPPLQSARELVMVYFKHWHPHFPFLHGPTFLAWIDSLYQRHADTNDTGQTTMDSDKLCQQVILQCVLGIADVSQCCLARSKERQHRPSSSDLLDLAAKLSVRPATLSLQALLAMELYLITAMSLHMASICHGVLVRAIYHSGYHRCPYRYVQLPHGQSREVRKRIFWSAYVMDRYLSQVLGIPIGLQDAEVDVCLPVGPELHSDVQPSGGTVFDSSTGRSPDVLGHLPKNHPDYPAPQRLPPASPSNLPPRSSETVASMNTSNSYDASSFSTTRPAAPTELILTYQVQLSQLLGELMGLFHGSIHSRQMTREKIQSLTYRVHAWWNSLPQSLEGQRDVDTSNAEDEATGNEPSETGVNYYVRFALSYNYALILLNRPFLSLPRDNLDFRESIQNAINASRDITRILETVQRDPFLLSWPMTLSASWMSGLVLSFAGLLRLVPMDKVFRELDRCSAILHQMSAYWPSSHHCHRALKRLMEDLKQQDRGGQPLSPRFSADSRTTNHNDSTGSAIPPTTISRERTDCFPSSHQETIPPRDKRQRLDPQGGQRSSNHDQSYGRAEMNSLPVADYGADMWSGTEAIHEPFAQDTGLLQLNNGGLFNDVTWEAFLDGCIPSFDL